MSAHKHLPFCIVLLLITLVLGCSNNGESIIRAVYLAPEENAVLQQVEFEGNQDIRIVHTQSELEDAVSSRIAIWIDKNSASLVEREWLNEIVRQHCPIVLVGYNDALYSFRDMLGGFGVIEGPPVDKSAEELEPGFSVWMTKEEVPGPYGHHSAYMKGFKEPPQVERILDITNHLLDWQDPDTGTPLQAKGK